MKAFRIFFRNIRDSFKSVFRNFSLSLASIICIIITLMVVAITIILTLNVNNFTEEVERDLTIVVFLEREVTLARIEEIKLEIANLNNIESSEFIDKMQIKDEMMESSESYNSLLDKYTTREENPLLDAFHIKVTDINHLEEVAIKIKEIANVESVKYGEGLVEQLISTFNTIRLVSIWIVGALIVVTAFLITNTIKITIFSRKREIEIMRLVGASNINIKIPFVFEGLFLGIFGAIAPIIATIVGYEQLYIKFSTQNISPFIQLIEPYPFSYYIAAFLLIIGALVGMIGSAFAVRKHLKI